MAAEAAVRRLPAASKAEEALQEELFGSIHDVLTEAAEGRKTWGGGDRRAKKEEKQEVQEEEEEAADDEEEDEQEQGAEEKAESAQTRARRAQFSRSTLSVWGSALQVPKEERARARRKRGQHLQKRKMGSNAEELDELLRSSRPLHAADRGREVRQREDKDGEHEEEAEGADREAEEADASAAQRKRRRREAEQPRLRVFRCRDASLRTGAHKGRVSSLIFRAEDPSAGVSASAAGKSTADSILVAARETGEVDLVRTDGTENNVVCSFSVTGMSTRTSVLLRPWGVGGAEEVLFAGRAPYLYSYDLQTGRIVKIPGVPSLRSHEHMVACAPSSRDGNRYVAFLGGGGYIHLMSARSKASVAEVKMNTPARTACFSTDENVLFGSGADAAVYAWDLRMTGAHRPTPCILRVRQEEGTPASTMSVSSVLDSDAVAEAGLPGVPTHVAVGADSGVVSVYRSRTLFATQSATALEAGLGEIAQPEKALMHLRTRTTALQFSPDSRLLCFASGETQDALRLAHIPSCAVVAGWPTPKTPIGRVTSLAFSPHETDPYLAVGNTKGRITLFQLRRMRS